MASPNPNKPGAVHFALIFFVLMTLVLGVTAFMFHKSITENAATLTKAQADKSESDKNNGRLLAENGLYKKTIGHEFEAPGAPGVPNNNTVIGAAEQDIALAGALAENNMKAAIRKLYEDLRQMTVQRDQMKTDKDGLEANLLALQQQYQGRVQEQLTARNAAETDLQKRTGDFDETAAQKDKDIESLKQAYNDLQTELDQEKTRAAKTIKDLEQHLLAVRQINKKQTQELEALRNDSFEKEDGLVRYVDNVNKLVWITLGEVDRLPVRTTFSVYGKDHNGVARGGEDIKGSIEVTRVLGPHLAEARILKDDLYNPIAPEDPIYTPLWSPGRGENFAIIGKMDLNADGKDDRDLLYEAVTTTGARVAIDVGLDGIRKGEKIDVDIKFLVVGDIPDPSDTSKAEEQKVIGDIIDQLKQLRVEAQENGVRIVSLGDFLSYIGHKNQQRLFKPGDERPYNLKFGSRSTSTSETLGERKAAGQTSGAYKNSQIKPKSADGQTSKLFRNGGR